MWVYEKLERIEKTCILLSEIPLFKAFFPKNIRNEDTLDNKKIFFRTYKLNKPLATIIFKGRRQKTSNSETKRRLLNEGSQKDNFRQNSVNK